MSYTPRRHRIIKQKKTIQNIELKYLLIKDSNETISLEYIRTTN